MLKKIYLTNFRGYKDRTEIEIDNLNVIVGKNDSGKSTIIKALDYFLNNLNNDSKPTSEDCYRDENNNSNSFVIECVFDGFLEKKVVIDETNEILLKEEFLLNSENLLHLIINFDFSGSKIKKTYSLKCDFPVEIDKDLIHKKLNDLEQITKEKELTPKNNAKLHELRKAIYESYDLTNKEDFEISIDEAKYKKLSEYLPQFFAFYCDRQNSEKDPEITDAAKNIIKKILETQKQKYKELERLTRELKDEMSILGKEVISTLQENFPEYQNENLDMDFAVDMSKIFSQGKVSTNGAVNFNNRGSGFRRLLLFSFFLNVAKSKKDENKNTIYALEEPEISQHPDNQRLIVDMINGLASQSQVLITTHSPGIVKLTNIEKTNFIIVEKNGAKHSLKVFRNNENIVNKISELLGIIDFSIEDLSGKKIIVLVEGRDDVAFFRRCVEILKKEDVYLFVPVGGNGNFVNYFDLKILEAFKLPIVEVYDSQQESNIGSKYERKILKKDDIQKYIKIIENKDDEVLKQKTDENNNIAFNRKGKINNFDKRILKLFEQLDDLSGLDEIKEVVGFLDEKAVKS
jgi:predicted ATP-dependent endonuclease of OLD family